MNSKNSLGVYIHWPFCASKCPYCDFNSHVREGIDDEDWASAYERAISYYSRLVPGREVVSIFFGGGTPSLMKPKTVERIVSGIKKSWRCADDLEVTLEANPTSVEIGKFKDFRSAGVSRVSLGIQALDDESLKFLGREHNAAEALQAIEIAQSCFERMSFDLIYARPGQTPETWARELERGLSLARGHLSLYQLTIERNTPFFMRHRRGEFSVPDEVEGAELYLLTQEMTRRAGVPAYEVSNHAAPGQECRHNMVYWNYQDYIGIGPGAHGRFVLNGQKVASRDHAAPEVWLQRVGEAGYGSHPFEDISSEAQREEALMVGFRLNQGIGFQDFRSRFLVHPLELIHPGNLALSVGEGWVRLSDERIVLTVEGMLRLNSLIGFLLSPQKTDKETAGKLSSPAV
ncbi:MAG: coproporphyrinogen III oxidase [Alphaproteobacteria bacterium]|nr:coproporphyrinogen III oxidase [Alphaproteobacteria bacterium]MBP7758856.1 coproporphyrinogen III oxidase [Alphaproteobacteria bacterium]MBP7762070.1 coproporphyrinogen III oxidase [Alphaproteobacteria bacterium]MBP7904627.1 coproporphyrinogen III oxidase [Alphaproteobacteria bacterium]